MMHAADPGTELNLSVVLPAYREEQSIASVIEKIHQVLSSKHSYEVLVVDDGSDDRTGELAKAAGARVIRHAYNIGNGAAVKTGIRNAKGKYIILMDADGQHDPADIPRFIEELATHDLVVGARTSSSETSWHRDMANSVYNGLASYVCNRKIPDLTSGFRGIRSGIAKSLIGLLPNTFSYPSTMTLAVLRSGFSIKFIPIETKKRIGKSKIKLFKDGIRFLLIIMRITTLYSPLKIFIPISLFTFFIGFGYGLFRIFALDARYGPTSAMLITFSVLIFLMGLVSEQITQLKYDQQNWYYLDYIMKMKR